MNSYESKSSAAGTYVELSGYRNRVVRDRNIFIRRRDMSFHPAQLLEQRHTSNKRRLGK
jgi:hypothetical protein